MSVHRGIGASALICFAVSLVAAFGWGNHWNAYTNLMLTLGAVVLWATLFASLRSIVARSAGPEATDA